MPPPDKIYVSKVQDVLDIYEKFTSESGDVPSKPLRYDRDVFLAAAVAGALHNKSEQLLPAERKEKFNWNTLLNDSLALPVLQALALLKTGDANLLLDEEKVVSIAEEYANAGIHILSQRLIDAGEDELHETAIYMAEVLESVLADQKQ